LFSMTLLRGVTRSKQKALRWMRKAAENGRVGSCAQLASYMYRDKPYAREVGHVEEAARLAAPAWTMVGHDVPPDVLTWNLGEATGVAISAGVMACHDVPPDVLTCVVHWLWTGGMI